MEKQKTLLVAGISLSEYPRNKVLVGAFSSNFTLILAPVENTFLGKWHFFKKLMKEKNNISGVLMIQPGHFFWLPLLVFRVVSRKEIIFDAFFSIYDSMIFDRKLASRHSLKAIYYYFLDVITCFIADVLIFDTVSHQDYFSRMFHLSSRKKKVVIPVSVDVREIDGFLADKETSIFSQEKFNVVFAGHYIPLQGVEYIIDAVNLLKKEENIHFAFIGAGQTKKEMLLRAEKYGLTNVSFLSRISYRSLLSQLSNADLSLGIFGNTEKAKRVIPNKVIESMACSVPVLTGRNLEMEKIFEDKKDIFFCPLSDAEALASSIRALSHEKESRAFVAKNGRKVVEEKFSKEYASHLIRQNFF